MKQFCVYWSKIYFHKWSPKIRKKFYWRQIVSEQNAQIILSVWRVVNDFIILNLSYDVIDIGCCINYGNALFRHRREKQTLQELTTLYSVLLKSELMCKVSPRLGCCADHWRWYKGDYITLNLFYTSVWKNTKLCSYIGILKKRKRKEKVSFSNVKR